MDNATLILSSHPSVVIAVLAGQAAIKAVKRQLQAKGLKPHCVERKIIYAAVDEYVTLHRQELIEEAAETVCKVPELRTLYEREQRDRRRNRR